MKALISILFLLIANNSFAEDIRYYDIEIIIVENLSEKSRASENWPLQVNLEMPEQIVHLGEPVFSDWLPKEVDLQSSYIKLDSPSYQLIEEVKNISESKTHRVIYHTAWRQPGLDKNLALPIYFKHEVYPPPILEAEINEISQNNGRVQDIDVVSVPKLEREPAILEGVLRVTLSRYLHLEAELTLKNKIPELIISDNPFSVLDSEAERLEVAQQGVIHLKQKRRRIRSNELHYVDHPVLGILIRITRYEKPKA